MNLSEKVAVLETKVERLQEDIHMLPTRPELELFNRALNDLAAAQTDIMKSQKEISDFINKWKTLGAVFLAIGAIVTQVISWAIDLINHLTTR